MYGAAAVELLRDLKRHFFLPPYAHDAVLKVHDEINALYRQVHAALQEYKEHLDEPEVATSLLLQHHALLRNKRCMLAYLHYRLEKIKELRWQMGPRLTEEQTKTLSKEETGFHGEYNKLLANYMKSMDLDLTADPIPPKDIFIEVRVLKDCGEVMTEDGSIITLARNTTHHLRRADVEHLVKQGDVEHIA